MSKVVDEIPFENFNDQEDVSLSGSGVTNSDTFNVWRKKTNGIINHLRDLSVTVELGDQNIVTPAGFESRNTSLGELCHHHNGGHYSYLKSDGSLYILETPGSQYNSNTINLSTTITSTVVKPYLTTYTYTTAAFTYTISGTTNNTLLRNYDTTIIGNTDYNYNVVPPLYLESSSSKIISSKFINGSISEYRLNNIGIGLIFQNPTQCAIYPGNDSSEKKQFHHAYWLDYNPTNEKTYLYSWCDYDSFTDSTTYGHATWLISTDTISDIDTDSNGSGARTKAYSPAWNQLPKVITDGTGWNKIIHCSGSTYGLLALDNYKRLWYGGIAPQRMGIKDYASTKTGASGQTYSGVQFYDSNNNQSTAEVLNTSSAPAEGIQQPHIIAIQVKEAAWSGYHQNLCGTNQTGNNQITFGIIKGKGGNFNDSPTVSDHNDRSAPGASDPNDPGGYVNMCGYGLYGQMGDGGTLAANNYWKKVDLSSIMGSGDTEIPSNATIEKIYISGTATPTNWILDSGSQWAVISSNLIDTHASYGPVVYLLLRADGQTTGYDYIVSWGAGYGRQGDGTDTYSSSPKVIWKAGVTHSYTPQSGSNVTFTLPRIKKFGTNYANGVFVISDGDEPEDKALYFTGLNLYDIAGISSTPNTIKPATSLMTTFNEANATTEVRNALIKTWVRGLYYNNAYLNNIKDCHLSGNLTKTYTYKGGDLNAYKYDFYYASGLDQVRAYYKKVEDDEDDTTESWFWTGCSVWNNLDYLKYNNSNIVNYSNYFPRRKYTNHPTNGIEFLGYHNIIDMNFSLPGIAPNWFWPATSLSVYTKGLQSFGNNTVKIGDENNILSNIMGLTKASKQEIMLNSAPITRY